MTREEAISIIEKHKYPDTCGQESLEKSNEAIDMAIEALKRLKNTAWLGTERELDDIKQAIQARDIASEALKIASEALKKVDSMIPLDGADIMLVTPEEYKAQEWIPCNKGLPENTRPVIVTWKNNDPKSYYQYIVGKHFIGTAHYHKGKWYWYSSVTEDLLAEYGKCETEEFDEAIEVVAWLPLPEPYKAESEE